MKGVATIYRSANGAIAAANPNDAVIYHTQSPDRSFSARRKNLYGLRHQTGTHSRKENKRKYYFELTSHKMIFAAQFKLYF